jgi:xanthine dehydrogenase YagS FAD-binding subunit
MDIGDNGHVRDVRLALGGVAHKPWRARKAEAALRGQPATEASFTEAANAELREARGLRDNAFKIDLTRRVVVKCLEELREANAAREDV